MISEPRTYTIPLRDAFREKAPQKKADAAVKAVKTFLSKHASADKDSIRLSSTINEEIWSRGARNPPAKVTVVATPDDGVVRALTEDEFAASQEAEPVDTSPSQEDVVENTDRAEPVEEDTADDSGSQASEDSSETDTTDQEED